MAGRTLSRHLADVAVRRKLPPGANQRARETRNSGDKKNENNPQGLLRSASATWATTILSKPASAAAEFEFKLGLQYATHPLTLRLIEAGQENPLAQVSTGKLYEVQKYCALSNHCWSGYWIVANRRALSSLPADLLDIVNSHFDAAAIRERACLTRTGLIAHETIVAGALERNQRLLEQLSEDEVAMLLGHIDRLTDTAAKMLDAEKDLS
jgi:hypothetical protein